MAISGFMPAWMKISSSDKSNGNQKLNIDRSSNNNDKRQLQNEINASILKGQYQKNSNEQQSSIDLDEQSENFFSFQSRRSFSRERLLNSFSKKGSEFNANDHSYTSNNRSLLNSNTNRQRRLHSTSTLSYNNGHISTDNHNNLTNGITLEHLPNGKHEGKHCDPTTKTDENKFDQIEKDFPSLNGRDSSLNNKEQSSIWNNASSKFRISNHGKFSHSFGSDCLTTRRDHLLSTPNNLNTNTRNMIHDLHTSYITHTKNLDKRNFLNSLKNNSNNENKHPLNETSKTIGNLKPTKDSLSLSTVPETPEEKDLLIRMGWNNDMAYEITDKDKEEYEKRIKMLPKIDNRSATLIKALHRRSLPCVNIRDLLQLETIGSTSDDDSSEE
ncbi:unnamed protein product [Rotaria socialis]|uniref:Uncharacterized protein n=1 Tax=Rotaria socialis TaxID=392032 RepID=A0A818XMR9_9BILA|nr:unnamed protein product [Rotaria socialis]CAF3581649.1 unnamed protein product [Rotaria socialis]CAF3637255.1 unnamed protein product [Rotaria socialis]CAF3641237.1 unnamed protein product [Rotaria socialis]CAF3739498.1 unnamed protein product [Rotaria socialis]